MEGTDEDATALAADINRIIKQTENDPSLNKSLVESRVNSFRSNLSMLNSSQQEDTPQEDIQSGAIMQELAGSLNSILEFAGFDPDFPSAAYRERLPAPA